MVEGQRVVYIRVIHKALDVVVSLCCFGVEIFLPRKCLGMSIGHCGGVSLGSKEGAVQIKHWLATDLIFNDLEGPEVFSSDSLRIALSFIALADPRHLHQG